MKESDKQKRARSAAASVMGKKGGKARAAKLTPEQRTAIAKKAAQAMWAKKKPAK